MSWSGPIAGTAPYQAPPYANGQHPPYPYGQQPPYNQYQPGPPYTGPPQRPPDSRPPKKKGNPIITRYPPPPGYRGPAQPQAPFNTHQQPGQYQPHSSGFPQAHPAQQNYHGQGFPPGPPQQGYPPQNYGQPQPPSFPPSYPQVQGYQWPQQNYQSNQTLHAPSYPMTQVYRAPQTSYRSYPPHPAAADPSHQAYGQGQGRPPAQPPASFPSQSQYNSRNDSTGGDKPMHDPNATPTPATAQLSATSSVSSHPLGSAPHENATSKPDLYLAWDDWDFDFDGAIWPKSNEPVDPNLSLGVIIWHPAKQMTRALPATFEEAESQSLNPAPEKLGNGESVSIYFMADNSHEAFLDVRQTDDWEYVRDDPAFVVFTDEEMQNSLVPVEDCIAQRDRPDESSADTKTEDAEMHEADWSIMDHLEQALSARGEDAEPASPGCASEPAGAQTQEDILASLGVTGLPKPVPNDSESLPTPAIEEKTRMTPLERPAVLPEFLQVTGLLCHVPELMSVSAPRVQLEPHRSQSLSGPRAGGDPNVPQRSYGSVSLPSNNRLPPPPPPPERDRYDPWNPSNRQHQYHTNGFNGGRGSPARSEVSNGTAAGSDFESEKPAETNERATTPDQMLERSDSSISRKRSYGDTDADDDRLRQHDDHTKRKRRSQVDAAYG